MMKCIAVDDEKYVLDLLVDNIQKVPFLKLVARCKNALEAAEVLHREPVDLIFLDTAGSSCSSHLPGRCLNSYLFLHRTLYRGQHHLPPHQRSYTI